MVDENKYYLPQHRRHIIWNFILNTQGQSFERQYKCTLALKHSHGFLQRRKDRMNAKHDEKFVLAALFYFFWAVFFSFVLFPFILSFSKRPKTDIHKHSLTMKRTMGWVVWKICKNFYLKWSPQTRIVPSMYCHEIQLHPLIIIHPTNRKFGKFIFIVFITYCFGT